LSGTTISNSEATLNFKSQPAVSELAPAQITVTALITLSQGSKVNIQKVIKFQNKSCCDGVVIYNGAWDYNDLPGDGAKGVSNAANNVDASWSPNIQLGDSWSTAITSLNKHFKATTIDLCFYKTDAHNSNGALTTANFANAVNKCASGEFADGDPDAGWYLPNERELASLYVALGGKGGSSIKFSTLIPEAGKVETTAADLKSGDYRSSTEYSSGDALTWHFNDGHIGHGGSAKGWATNARCVRRL
jgi:hypothetical protein